MENKYKLINTMMVICLVLNLVGCGATSSATASSITVNSTDDAAMLEDHTSIDTQTSDTQEQSQDSVDVEQDELAENLDEATEAIKAAEAANTDEYPSTDDILAIIDAGESKVYWGANGYEATGSLNVISVSDSDISAVWEELSGVLGFGYSAQDMLIGGFTVVSNNSDIDAVINALSQITGMDYIETDPGDGYTTRYVPTVDGYYVDAEGYSSGSNGDYISGPYVGVRDNGSVYISMPVRKGTVQDTVDASDFISVQNVEALCSAYYENYGIPSVVVVESVELAYYYSNANQQLRPAWICQTTAYMSQNGHGDSVLIDAITGEMLRK